MNNYVYWYTIYPVVNNNTGIQDNKRQLVQSLKASDEFYFNRLLNIWNNYLLHVYVDKYMHCMYLCVFLLPSRVDI